MVKEINFVAKNGQFDPETAPIRGSVSFKMGSHVTELVNELQEKYGEDYSDRPVFVVSYNTEEAAEEALGKFESFVPSNYISDELKETMDEEALASYDNQHQEFKDLAKPTFKRVGSEVVISREESIEEMTAAIEPFAELLSSMDNSFSGTFAYRRSASEILSNKHSIIYGIYNGGYADVRITLEDNLVESIVEQTGAGETMPGQIANIAWKLFKSSNITVEVDDCETLEQKI